jgi:hypothetical protein
MGLLHAIKDALHTARDAGASYVAERYAAQWVQPYGRMLNLTIDSKNKKLRVEILPKGETDPLAVTIDEYELVTKNGVSSILVKRVSASREWVDAIVKDFATGKTIPLPEKYANVLKTVL